MKRNVQKQRIIDIRGEHANVRELSVKEKKELGFRARQQIIKRMAWVGNKPAYSIGMALWRQQIIKRMAWVGNKPAYSIGMALCNVLYPKEVPMLIASSLDKRATYSEKKVLSRKSQEAIDDFYGYMQKTGYGGDSKKFQVYLPTIGNLSDYRSRIIQIERESGIKINAMKVNIGVEKGGKHFVFFEPKAIEIGKLESFIRKMPSSLRKKQALKLLNGLKKLAPPGETSIYFH